MTLAVVVRCFLPLDCELGLLDAFRNGSLMYIGLLVYLLTVCSVCLLLFCYFIILMYIYFVIVIVLVIVIVINITININIVVLTGMRKQYRNIIRCSKHYGII